MREAIVTCSQFGRLNGVVTIDPYSDVLSLCGVGPNAWGVARGGVVPLSLSNRWMAAVRAVATHGPPGAASELRHVIACVTSVASSAMLSDGASAPPSLFLVYNAPVFTLFATPSPLYSSARILPSHRSITGASMLAISNGSAS